MINYQRKTRFYNQIFHKTCSFGVFPMLKYAMFEVYTNMHLVQYMQQKKNIILFNMIQLMNVKNKTNK